MANPQTIPVNEEDFWVDGAPSSGIKITLVVNTGDEKYWVDGAPEATLYPLGNNDTGKFHIMFE